MLVIYLLIGLLVGFYFVKVEINSNRVCWHPFCIIGNTIIWVTTTLFWLPLILILASLYLINIGENKSGYSPIFIDKEKIKNMNT